MIGKGAQYLTAAGFGRYRITAASLGSLDLLGTLSWLKAAAQQAIMAAFGVDGTAVIRATNEYLNGIAASDWAKATALAGFMNTYAVEDAHIVYSLVPTLGVTRWIANGGSAWINTELAPTHLPIKTKIHCVYNSIGEELDILGNWVGGSTGNIFVAGMNGSAVFLWKGAAWSGIRSAYANTEYTLEYNMWASDTEVKVNDETYTRSMSFNITGRTDAYISIFSGGGNRSYCVPNAKVSICEIEVDGVSHMYIPFIRNNVNGMIDLTTGTFFQNGTTSGSFTISETPTPLTVLPKTPEAF